jgi:excinuclease ABC subunit A
LGLDILLPTFRKALHLEAFSPRLRPHQSFSGETLMKHPHGVISIRGAKEHNLKNVSIDIPREKLVVITGLSGSGKSSLAFDTLYAEGQRRYVESLSAYARQFLNIQDKPDVESIEGLSPAIAIDQKTTSKNPRSTVGTVTEIYDYLRLLYARVGVPYSPATGKPITAMTVSQMVDKILELHQDTKIYLLAPIVRGRKGEHVKELLDLKKRGFTRVKINGELFTMEELPQLDKNKKHTLEVVVDRISVNAELGNRLADSVETALSLSDGLLHVEIVESAESGIGKEGIEKKGKGKKGKGDNPIPDSVISDSNILTFSSKFACPESGFTLEEIEPRLFSFNSPYGACPTCDGIGTQMYFDEAAIVPDPSLTLFKGAVSPWASSTSKFYLQTLDGLAAHYKFSMHEAWEELSEKVRNIILNGSGDEPIAINYYDGVRSYKSNKPFEGVIPNMQRRYRETDSDGMREDLEKYMSQSACETCGGYRLKPEALCVKVGDRHVGEVCQFSIEDAAVWFAGLDAGFTANERKIAEKVLKEIRERLGFLINVGLEYLTLARYSGTLSGGEAQRIRLASQIGSGLSGVVYVLDEPSIGLHQCDNERLLATLEHLRDLGNTVIVVEHDEDTMRKADWLIDIGPGAGVNGGRVISEGTPKEVAEDPNSITGQYLSGKRQIDVPEKRRGVSKHKRLVVKGCTANNLRNITVEIPLGVMSCVTGVSGGGKSSFVIETLYKAASKRIMRTKDLPAAHESITGLEYLDKVIEIDQSPIGRTPRSNPATYTGAFGPIRDWFAALPDSKARGYKSGRFSFNVKGGRCEACQGDGLIKIEMHFLPDVYVTCDVCKGKRYNRETLEVLYRDKSIADVLNMTVDEAVDFFTVQPSIQEKCLALQEVGLGYIRLGQSATTLSGGEAQRIKLAKELSKRATGRTLYILDEPTTGLHSEDIRRLLVVLQRLVDQGNTMVIIEHNLDVVKCADWVVDIGPGGGDKGGHLVVSGTPEQVAECKTSRTGEYLKPLLEKAKGKQAA